MIPLLIEDKYVRNYLWERGLVAVQDRCMRSHPHEFMDEYCQHKTNLARLMNKEAQDDATRARGGTKRFEPCPFIECDCDGNHPLNQPAIRARGQA